MHAHPTPQHEAAVCLTNARDPKQPENACIYARWCGVNSFIAGIPIEENPFKRNAECDLWECWNSSWMAGKKNAQDAAALAEEAEEKKPYWQKM